MKAKLTYILMLAAVLLAGCKDKNPANEPTEGEVITLSFSIESEIEQPAAPARICQEDPTKPGDPGKDDFVPPTHLYFVLWVETTGHTKEMIAIKESSLSKSDWQEEGRGIYTLKDRKYKFIIPKDGVNVQQLEGGVFHVFAYASNQEVTPSPAISFTEYSSLTDAEKTDGKAITTTTTTLATLEGLTYALPAGATTQDTKRTFFRSMYSTALSETSHNQMATSPTIRLRHTAARLDINWECDPAVHATGLTPNSTWTIATNYPTAFSLFKPGANTGATAWSETITIDEGNRYNGRYVTYLPMPTTPTFTVTSSTDAINPEGADATAKKTMTLPLSAGTDINYATWMRALWTIR